MRPELANWAIERFTLPGHRILDPFCGSGTVLLEAWSSGRHSVGTDLNPYAFVLSMGKVHSPIPSGEDLQTKLDNYREEAESRVDTITNWVDDWAASFFHPRTLQEALAWVSVLRDAHEYFLLSCLLGILHHQRPGFLSFPASHTVPYLRTTKFPPDAFSNLYEYRAVYPRLQKKVLRVATKLANSGIKFSPEVQRQVIQCDASESHSDTFDAIITSPPYMGQLHYGRDNRLRLQFLGETDWEKLDRKASPRLNHFLQEFPSWISQWSKSLRPGGRLVLLVGDKTNTTRRPFAELVSELVTTSGNGFSGLSIEASSIPDKRRTRKNCEGSSSELLISFERE